MMVPPSSLVARKKKEILQTRNFDFIFSLGNDEADRPSSDDVACRKHSSNPDWKLTLVKAEASHRPPFFFSPTHDSDDHNHNHNNNGSKLYRCIL